MVRQSFFQPYLSESSLGTRHIQFERQWNRLDALTRSGVPIDCIALGNSMTYNGFDPRTFNRVFSKWSGRKITCFNFGVDALTPVSASALARILLETYQPRLLIYGIDARDFAIDFDSEETSVIMDADWIQYQLGHPNLKGWLVEHSSLYRYRHSLTDFAPLAASEDLSSAAKYGYGPMDDVFDSTTLPDPKDDWFHVQYYFGVLKDYSVRPENRQALSELVRLQEMGTTMVVVEMPVSDMYFHFFEDPMVGYGQFLKAVREITTDYDVLLVETSGRPIIPPDGWMDYVHVNRKGASVFSAWLGRQLGQKLQLEPR